MWQLQIISYFDIYENIARYFLTFTTKLNLIKIFSLSLFFLHLVFYSQIWTRTLKNLDPEKHESWKTWNKYGIKNMSLDSYVR